nr:hypothetical protein [Microbulbifer sediminum]
MLGPVLSLMGSMQASEAIKLLLGLPVPSLARLQIFKAQALELRSLQLQGNNQCVEFCAG